MCVCVGVCARLCLCVCARKRERLGLQAAGGVSGCCARNKQPATNPARETTD